MEKENTHSSNKFCEDHDRLDKKVTQAIKEGNIAIKRSEANIKGNNKEHSEILANIEIIMTNINWMNVIGKWILLSLFGYFIVIGYFIFSNDWVEQKEFNAVENLIRKGETLHYQNERSIEGIETKIDILLKDNRNDRNDIQCVKRIQSF